MPVPLTPEETAHRLAVVAECRATGQTYTEAARILGMQPNTLREWLRNHAPGDIAGPSSQARAPEEPLAARQERRLRDEINRLKTERDQANRELNDSEDLRQQVFGLSKPFDPVDYPLAFDGTDPDQDEIPILFQSDEQWGEVIKREEMGGLNAYNQHIASARYKRLIESAIKCCLPPNVPAPPPMFYYLMGGDSLSGSIHEELAETNDLSSIPAVKSYCAHVRWGIETLKRELGCPIRVVRVPGNHDRLTRKPRHKGYNEHSLDTVISWHLEMLFEGDPDVTFFVPPENDAYFDIYGWKFLLTHGDMMGTGGGTGYIGAVAPITKGHRKLVETYMQAGKRVDYVLTGHFHTAVETEYGWGNGCLPGFSEYARLKIRAKPSPPVQWLLHVHPVHGVTTRRKLAVAAPDEGDLYQLRAAA